MKLKEIVDKVLRDQNRSLSWLAAEMGKTFDGLKLSLVKGSLKYTDLIRMADILKMPPSHFFNDESASGFNVEEEKVEYSSLKTELNSCRELTATLKSQLVDKEKIIELLGERR